MLQIGFKMSSNICLIKNVAKNIVAVVVGLTLCFTTPLKCYSLAYRTMPEMNENNVSKYVMILTSTLSVFVCGIKFFGETKPTYNQVSFTSMIFMVMQIIYQFFLDDVYGIL